jgi:N,N'-diacetyllegionaminate synthase
MNEQLELDGCPVDRNGPVLVVAEIGVNHDGKLERAIQLVHAAQQAGADAVKLQIFSAERLMHRSSVFARYQKTLLHDPTPTDMLRRFELSETDVRVIVDEIRQVGLIPLATPFSLEDVDEIEALDLPAIKIASPDIVNWPLLRRAAATGLPLLVSTGAANINEVSSSVAWLRGWGSPFALLHCISSYPTPPDDANLCWIDELARRFNIPTGFSDHTTQILCGALAVTAGAAIIEKHLTYDRNAQGPDHAASFDPKEFTQYVQFLRLAERMRGLPGKHVLQSEQDVRTVSRQSVVAARDLPHGHLIQETDLTVQRPGTGIPASALPSLIGCKIDKPIQSGQLLTWQAINDAA